MSRLLEMCTELEVSGLLDLGATDDWVALLRYFRYQTVHNANNDFLVLPQSTQKGPTSSAGARPPEHR